MDSAALNSPKTHSITFENCRDVSYELVFVGKNTFDTVPIDQNKHNCPTWDDKNQQINDYLAD